MAHLSPHFDPDVFVSYSHGDPADGKSPLKDWTQELIRKLEKSVRALDTEFDELNLWMDDKIDPTLQLTTELRSKVSTSGILIIVMSKRYLDSSWCKKELEWFRKQIQDRAGDAGRLFVIRSQKTDEKKWPDFLCDEDRHSLPGFIFHDQGQENDGSIPWGWLDSGLHEMGTDFRREFHRLHLALTKRLRELRARGDQRLQPAMPPEPMPIVIGPQRVYLHSPPEADAVRADVEQALSSNGIEALLAQRYEGGLLKGMNRESKLRIETAKRCNALALLRVEVSDRSDADLYEIGVDERDRITIARGAPMPCAVLDKTGESLPYGVSSFGIKQFDVKKETWRGEFKQWLDAARGHFADVP